MVSALQEQQKHQELQVASALQEQQKHQELQAVSALQDWTSRRYGVGVKSYRDLLVWQRAMDLVEWIYRATGSWPKEELYGLTSQLRRASVSVPANIAEGQGRRTSKEFLQFLSFAYGSLMEVETHLFLGRRLGYLQEEQFQASLSSTEEVGRMINGLSASLERKQSPKVGSAAH